jgi:hypothetical protein
MHVPVARILFFASSAFAVHAAINCALGQTPPAGQPLEITVAPPKEKPKTARSASRRHRASSSCYPPPPAESAIVTPRRVKESCQAALLVKGPSVHSLPGASGAGPDTDGALPCSSPTSATFE